MIDRSSRNDLGRARDLNDITINLLLVKMRYWTLLVFIIFVTTIYLFVTTLIEIIIIIPFFLSLFYLYYVFGEAQALFMKEFAKDNGYDFENHGSIKTVEGKLFQVGRRRMMGNVIGGNYKGYPIRIFNYFFTVGYGRNSYTHRLTILELSFKDVYFPHILLRSRKMMMFRGIKGNTEQVSLDDEFRKDFELFVQRGYEVEAMQIFTPETLKAIKEKAAKFSIEFYGRTVCFFDNKMISRNRDLQELHDVLEEVVDSIEPLIKRLCKDFDVLHEYYKKGQDF